MDCCCAGTENNQNGGEELVFPVSQVSPCRDTLCPHPRASSCDLLAQLPCSVPLNSGYFIDIYHIHIPPFPSPPLTLSLNGSLLNRIYIQTLLSNEPKWLLFSNGTDSTTLDVSKHLQGKQYQTTAYCSKQLTPFSFSLQETVGTRVLIPFPFGLVELFVAKHV